MPKTYTLSPTGNPLSTKGRIVLVPFPFDDLSATKARPAVCLTEPIGKYKHVVLAFISSRLTSDLSESDVVIDSGNPDFVMTGLKVPSVIRLHRITTVTASIIQRELGQLSPQIQEQLTVRLKTLFELA